MPYGLPRAGERVSTCGECLLVKGTFGTFTNLLFLIDVWVRAVQAQLKAQVVPIL